MTRWRKAGGHRRTAKRGEGDPYRMARARVRQAEERPDECRSPRRCSCGECRPGTRP